MSVFLRIDINIAAMILLGTVFVMAYIRLDKHDILNRKFLVTSFLVLIELLFESITCIINRRPEHWLIPITVLMHIFIFTTAPILSYFWYEFIHSWINLNIRRTLIKRVILYSPIIINSIFAILSPIFGFIFYIDSSNIYHRGSMFFISAAVTYIYLLYSLVYILSQWKSLLKQEIIPLFMFGMITALGGLIQSLFYGILLMWSFAAFSLVIVFIYLQQRMVHLDSLTGAWTRESFEQYIRQRAKQKMKFGAIYIDLDGFKQVNDGYGHLEGDLAIKTTVHLIKSLLRKTDIIARLGGDEFILIFDGEVTKEKLELMINKIETKLKQYNKKSGKEYELKCSFGADIYKPEYGNLEQFLCHVDKLMYKNKRSKKFIG